MVAYFIYMVFHCQEEAWLYTAKMAGYGISIVLLLVYILTIQVLCHSNLCTLGSSLEAGEAINASG